MNENVAFSLSAQSLQGTLTNDATIQGVLTSPAMMQAIFTQGPMIVNDYVFTVEEMETMYIFTARKGSEVQTIRLPKAGSGGGVDFVTDETLILENGLLRVNTTDSATENDARPITSQGVYNEFSVINALLKTI